MANGFSQSTATAILDAICNNVPFQVGQVYVQLHVGAPGAAGTANVATETTRKPASFAAAAAPGTIANDAALTWTNILGAQDATDFTAWTASSGGTFLFSGSITAAPYAAGNTLNFAVGALTASIPVAS